MTTNSQSARQPEIAAEPAIRTDSEVAAASAAGGGPPIPAVPNRTPPVAIWAQGAEAQLPHEPGPRRAGRWERPTLGLLGIAIVLTIYTLVADLAIKNSAILPTPQRIFSTGVHDIGNGTIPQAIWASLKRVLTGYALGSAAGVLIGTSMGWFKRVEYLIAPLVEAMRPIPGLAFVPLVILWFGIGETSKVLVIAEAAFVVSVVNARAGMKEVANTYVEAAETLGATRFQVFYSVALPSAIPYLFAGLRVALAVSWATLVAAELIAAQQGLGFLLQEGSQFFQTDLVMVVIVFIGALATVMDQILRAVQRRVTKWAEVKR
jgi:ABC-type nitrate/sulfonate/bicarbonate transport system permease component